MRVFVEDRRYPDRVTHATGYAEVQRQVILGLSALDVTVGFPPCKEKLRTARLITPSQRDRLLRISQTAWEDGPDAVYLQVASPDGFEPRPGRLTVGLTMTERESLLGYGFDWATRCNGLHGILTPSRWNKQTFERHGIHNVHVVPLGVDVDFFSPRPVRFLSVFAGFGWPGSRANWEDLALCYKDEFQACDDVEWTIVSLEARQPFRYGGLAHALRQLPADLQGWLTSLISDGIPRISVVEGGTLEPDRLKQIYRDHDCFLSYSREGWGLPLLEAMACGLDVITCDYGAPMEFLAGGPARLFRAGRLREDNLRFVQGDLLALRGHMRAVYDEQRKTRRWAEHLAWSRAMPQLRTLLEDLLSSWQVSRG